MALKSLTGMTACAVLLGLAVGTPAAPITVTHGTTSVTLEMVEIGDAGNAADPNSFTGDYGDVDYDYKIGKYEISVNQWDTAMGAAPSAGHSWSGDQPVANVRLFEAAKFCNWLTSGDPTLGVYTLGSLPTVTAIDRPGALATYGTIFVLPTNDEWHKAAYYNSATASYQKHPTGPARPTAVTGGTAQDTAVYTYGGEASPTAPADIDNAGGLSPYGTMAQAGNVQEYVEGLVVSTGPYWRAGAYNGSDYMFRNTTTQFGPGSTWNANSATGFRVLMIPEPATLSLLAIGGSAALARRRR